MCTEAMNNITGEEISSIGDIRKIAPIVFFTQNWTPEDSSNLPDECCLCPVDVLATLVYAGFKVWRNPDVLPEFLFEPVEERV